MMKKVDYITNVAKMPCDRYEDGMGFIHATGRAIVYTDGSWDYEYEDYEDTVELPTSAFAEEIDNR